MRQGGPPGRSRRRPVREAVIVVVLSATLAFTLYQVQLSGTIRWILGSLIIALLAAYAWFTVTRLTSEPPVLAPAAAGEGVQTGDLASLGAMVRRANAGLPYSQVAVSSRAREAFAQRIALARGLSLEAARDLEEDPETLKALVHDPVLEDFLFLRSSDHDERYRWVRDTRDRGGFEAALQEVLERMEAWR